MNECGWMDGWMYMGAGGLLPSALSPLLCLVLLASLALSSFPALDYALPCARTRGCGSGTGSPVCFLLSSFFVCLLPVVALCPPVRVCFGRHCFLSPCPSVHLSVFDIFLLFDVVAFHCFRRFRPRLLCLTPPLTVNPLHFFFFVLLSPLQCWWQLIIIYALLMYYIAILHTLLLASLPGLAPRHRLR